MGDILKHHSDRVAPTFVNVLSSLPIKTCGTSRPRHTTSCRNAKSLVKDSPCGSQISFDLFRDWIVSRQVIFPLPIRDLRRGFTSKTSSVEHG